VLLEDVLRGDVGGTDHGFKTGGFAEKHCGVPFRWQDFCPQ
jgi:hypothetical protein